MAIGGLGSNWFPRLDTIHRLSGLTWIPTADQLPRKKIMPNIIRIADKIFNLWETLKRLDGEGRVGSFQAQWGPLHSEARDGWLQRSSIVVPDLAICALAQNPKEPLDQQLFLSPQLNIKDLAQANVLLDLLQTTSTIHPKAFLSTGSRFVPLGCWRESFPKMCADGRLVLL